MLTDLEICTENRLFHAHETRKIDQLAIEQQGITGYELMTLAGEKAWQHLRERWPQHAAISVYCGTGNNGGDGYVLARLAHTQGYKVNVIQLGDIDKIKGNAFTALKDYQAAGGQSCLFAEYTLDSNSSVLENTLAIDALLGTGLERAVENEWLLAIQQINRHKSGVLAIDIPSGLHSDNGCIMGEAVKADVTVTFMGKKQGLYTADGPDCCGKIIFESLGVRDSVYQQIPMDTVSTCLIEDDFLKKVLKPRNKNTHKGSNGHVLIVGGVKGMSGAVMLAAKVAMRAGAGVVSIATDPAHAVLLDTVCPEIMCHGIANDDKGIETLRGLIDKADVIALGPGLGQAAWSRKLYAEIIDCKQALVLDADGLNLLSEDINNKIFSGGFKQNNRVLTPHPGEAAKLLSCGSAEIQHNRFDSVRKLAELTLATVVLKGVGSLISSSAGASLDKAIPTWLCNAGNPGMAVAGMGDVLTGVIAAMMAQGLPAIQAAKAGVLIHAQAGDEAAKLGERGLIASDLSGFIRLAVNP